MQPLTKNDCEFYLNSGELTRPFLDKDYILEKVMLDYNSKIQKHPNYTILESLFHWIQHCVPYSQDGEFRNANKFQRTAKEMWESGNATGCTDYAQLFATLARQLGYPTTILHTAEYNWLKRLKTGGDSMMHIGHSFCECFYEGKWVLVDPMAQRIEFDYNPEKIELSYEVGGNSIFIPYFRGLDIGFKHTTEEHCNNMDKLCKDLEI